MDTGFYVITLLWRQCRSRPVLGGRYRPVGGSLIGSITLETLERFTVNVAFIGVSGVTSEGLSVADVEEANLAQAVIDRSRRVIIPADHTKIGATHFSRIGTLDGIDTIVTDKPSATLQRLCSYNEIELLVAAATEMTVTTHDYTARSSYSSDPERKIARSSVPR